MTKKKTVKDEAVCTEHHAPSTKSGARAKVTLMGEDEARSMAEFFTVLADPNRLRLVSLLANDECCVCDLADKLNMSESAVSHQLRALRAGRLVSYRKEGRQVFYRLHHQHVLDLYTTVREHLAE